MMAKAAAATRTPMMMVGCYDVKKRHGGRAEHLPGYHGGCAGEIPKINSVYNRQGH